jgi:anti-sigma-K factor RskA
MAHEEYQELLTASALTALDPSDAQALGEHLKYCAECRAELSEWENTAALLTLDAQPLEPSARVRDRLLASIREEPQTKARVVPLVRSAANVWTLGSFGTIAATIIFAAMLISLIVLWQRYRSFERELARTTAELREARTQIEHDRAVAALLTSPGAKMATLAGTKMAPAAQAMLAYNKEGHAMFMAKGLPATPAGMAYQLWFIKDGKKMPGKVFSIDAAGNGSLEDEVPAVARESAVFAITLEPEGGVQSPTGSIYLVSTS